MKSQRLKEQHRGDIRLLWPTALVAIKASRLQIRLICGYSHLKHIPLECLLNMIFADNARAKLIITLTKGGCYVQSHLPVLCFFCSIEEIMSNVLLNN